MHQCKVAFKGFGGSRYYRRPIHISSACKLNLTPTVGRSERMDLADLGKQNNTPDYPV